MLKKILSDLGLIVAAIGCFLICCAGFLALANEKSEDLGGGLVLLGGFGFIVTGIKLGTRSKNGGGGFLGGGGGCGGCGGGG